MIALAAALALHCGALLMPPRGAYQGTTYEPDPIIRIIDYWNVDAACRAMGARVTWRIPSCARGLVIVLPRVNTAGVTLDWQRCTYWHEQAHRHGWPENHPYAVFW